MAHKAQLKQTCSVLLNPLSFFISFLSNSLNPKKTVMDPKLSFVKTLIRNAITSRSYYTSRTKKPTLYTKISPLGDHNQSVAPELDDWVSKGNKVSIAELQRLIRDLRNRKRFSQALEVSEWMNEKGVCTFRTTEHAVQLDLIGRVRGFVSAEEYFSKLGEAEKDCRTYGALLNCYVRQLQTEKSLTHLRKMQELGFASSPLDYNGIMCLYTNSGQHEKVPGVMAEMKENNISPDNFSYRILINSYGVRSDLEGVEKVLKEMEDQPHIVMDWNTYAVVADLYMKAGQTNKAIDALKKSEERLNTENGVAYQFLISMYAKMGNKDEILRLWGFQKSVCKRCINRDYICMLVSLVKLSEFEEAEMVLKEWEMSGNCYDFKVPQTLVVGYTAKGLHERAEALLEDLMNKGKPTNLKSWESVASGYVAKGEMEKALKCMKVALNVWTEEGRGRRPDHSLITILLNWLGDECSVDVVEVFVGSLRKVMPVNRQMYHALLKAYIRGGEDVSSIVERMKTDNIDHDEETMKILDMRPT